MKIYVYNCSNTFNYGSMMMGENFISYFNQVTGEENIYYVETDDEINVQRLKSAVLSDKIYTVPFNSLFAKGFNKYDYLLSQMKLKKALSDFAGIIDLVVVLGGDDFTEDYGWKSPLLYAIQFNLLRREGIKLVMVGQTMGPFHSFRGPAMKSLLRNINKIYPRERLTYQYLMNLGLNNISLTDDLALLPLARQEPKERSEEYITFCPSELIYRYCKEGSRESWISFNVFMIDLLMMRYPDKKVILLAHVLRPEAVDDRTVVNELYDLLKEKYKDRLIPINSELYPYEVRSFIRQSLFLVSGRMHAVVSSFQCGTPAITLSYSSKSLGIIGDRYGLGEYIIDVRTLNYAEMRERYVSLLDRMAAQYPLIIEKIGRINELAQKSILRTLEEIRDLKEIGVGRG